MKHNDTIYRQPSYRFKIKRRWEEVYRLAEDIVSSTGMIQGVESVCFSFTSSLEQRQGCLLVRMWGEKNHYVKFHFISHRDMCGDSCKDRPTFYFKYKLRWVRKYAC